MEEPAYACSNEVLRSELHSGQLPDCRAYELVTPPYKEETFMSSLFAISQDGSHVLGASLGVFQGTEGDGLGNISNLFGATYEFSRTGEGWKASSLTPPSSEYRSNGLFDAGTELTDTLWELGKRKVSPPGGPQEEALCPSKEGEEEAQPEGVTDFYLERPRETFTRVGPATPNSCVANSQGYLYVGGSEDLSRIVFWTAEGFHWPFDATEGPNTLYEYIGAGAREPEPILVGVSGRGGSTQLESRCGTLLGSSSAYPGRGSIGGSTYNAISADGTRVYFTALACGAQPQVNELFAREELPAAPGEVPAKEARTVAISEPAKEGCSICDTSQPASAVFQGASEDGSKVFFTTEQELLPGTTTGENLYEYDFDRPAGERVTLVSEGAANPEVQGVARISEDGSHVYFVARGRLTSSANGAGETATEGLDNLYVSAEGRVSFVATLSEDDTQDWAAADERPVQASRDGRFLVFVSQADLTHENLSLRPGVEQVFQYDAQTGDLVRASIGQNGYNNDGKTPVYGAQIVTYPPSSYSYVLHDSPTQADGVLAPEDGAVFFLSPDALTPQALSDQTDSIGQPEPNVYEYRAGHVYLISDGQDVSTVKSAPGVRLIGSDATGEDVFFTTSDPLVAQDTDTQQDIYDARVGGGFPAPASPAGCLSEECRGPLDVIPALPGPGSAAQVAEGASAPANTTVTSKPEQKRKSAKHKKKTRKRARRARRTARAGRRRSGSGPR
jgi:hypothetical protein